MDPRLRTIFNEAFSPELFERVMNRVESRVGHVLFRVAETPLLITPGLRDGLVGAGAQIIEQLSRPALLAKLRAAVPAQYDMPGMDALPNTAQVDFALVEGADGKLEGRLIELQGFPSLYGFESVLADEWAAEFAQVPGLGGAWSCFVGDDPPAAHDLIRRTLLGGCGPEETVLVDIEPEGQKTSVDFAATRQLYGIDAVCITRLQREGRRLFREKDGKRLPVKRIYNRVVFDELERKQVQVPFRWTDELDVSWCSHPNWFWVWSKYCLPFIDHPWAPRATFVSDLRELPEDPSRYVLKPLFSFAGRGVVMDVTREAIEQIPENLRDRWILQERIEYAPAIRTPEGAGVKAEVRVMFARPPEEPKMTPVLLLVRLSRGKMLGVDFNKDFTWVGGSVGMWPVERTP